MRRLAWMSILLIPLGLAPVGRCEDPRPADVQALQDHIQKTIEKAEPSIVCILVSRSDDYRRLDAAPPDPAAGKLGGFVPPTGYRPPNAGPPNGDKEKEMRRLVQTLDLSNPEVVPESFGSGVVLDADNALILTMAHVVRNATKIYVRLPGGRGSWADVHAADPRSDLAVLRLLEKDKLPKLQPVKFGDGSHLKKGQFVILLANPFAAGFRDGSPSASWGIVSNLQRRASGVVSEMERPGAKPTLQHYGTLIQTDVRIALGCSGGALLNLDGELIGVTTAQAALAGSEAPGGYAVPLDDAVKRIIDVLTRGDEVEYGFLGVQFQADAQSGRGVRVTGVAEASPAERAGLSPNDLITAINGNPIHDNDDLYLQIGICLAGGTARVEATGVDGQHKTLTVTLAKSYTPGGAIASHRPPARAGLRVDYASTLSQRLGLKYVPSGVVIREVSPDSPADKARLQADYVITRVGDRAVTTPAEFYDAMARASGSVVLTVTNLEEHEDRVTIDLK
jgi:S1-C subfamily serine protease